MGLFFQSCSCCTVFCGDCENDEAPPKWEVAVSGVSDDVCQDCSRFNKTHTLKYISFCVWETDQELQTCDSEIPGGLPEVYMEITEFANNTRVISVMFEVQLSSATKGSCFIEDCIAALYELVEDTTAMDYDPDCIREFTLPKVSSTVRSVGPFASAICANCHSPNDACSGWPSSITLVPA